MPTTTAISSHSTPLRYNQEKHQEAFDSVKQALADATTLAAQNEQGRFVLDTDASTVTIAGILHQEQEYNGKTSPSHGFKSTQWTKP